MFYDISAFLMTNPVYIFCKLIVVPLEKRVEQEGTPHFPKVLGLKFHHQRV